MYQMLKSLQVKNKKDVSQTETSLHNQPQQFHANRGVKFGKLNFGAYHVRAALAPSVNTNLIICHIAGRINNGSPFQDTKSNLLQLAI